MHVRKDIEVYKNYEIYLMSSLIVLSFQHSLDRQCNLSISNNATSLVNNFQMW